MKLKFFSRIPTWDKIAPVYAVIVLMVYTWTILWYFWKIPSWLLFMTVWELLSAFSFALATNLLESLTVLFLILLLCIILPKKWFYDVFVSRGATLALSGLWYMTVLAKQFEIKKDYPTVLLAWTPAILAAIVLLVVIVGLIPLARKIIEALAERLTVFLFISIPLSILALVGVAVEMLF
jgi:hypothetical protein